MNTVVKGCGSFPFNQSPAVWSIYFLTSFIFLTNTGCKKSDQATPFTPNYNVYMAGTLDGNAAYWKNGIPTILSTNGNAYAIGISGSDIYVCGRVNAGNTTIATYWKNGKETSLENQASSEALGMAIQGDDIYFAGTVEGPDSTANAVYWKNGVSHYLSSGSGSLATGIVVNGQETYISGHSWSAASDSAVVWKNGEKVFFGEMGSMGAVGFNGADTFFLGTLMAAPTYWAHNKMTKLYKNGYAVAMAFSGSDVYFAGGVRPNSTDNYAAIWKNDSLTILTDQYSNSTVSGIAVAGADVYAVGYVDPNAGFEQFTPVYWKNGVMTKLGANGVVSSISIGH